MKRFKDTPPAIAKAHFHSSFGAQAQTPCTIKTVHRRYIVISLNYFLTRLPIAAKFPKPNTLTYIYSIANKN